MHCVTPRFVLLAIPTDRHEHMLTVTAATFIVVLIIVTFQRCADKISIHATACVITACTFSHTMCQPLPLPFVINVSAVLQRFVPNITLPLWKVYISVASPGVKETETRSTNACPCGILVDNRARTEFSCASISNNVGAAT